MAEITFSSSHAIAGADVGDHVKRAAKAGVPAFIKILRDSRRKPPQRLKYLMDWYNDVRAQQLRGMHVEPMQLTEIEAFGRLFDLDLAPWEVDVLCRLDRVWLRCLPEPGGK